LIPRIPQAFGDLGDPSQPMPWKETCAVSVRHLGSITQSRRPLSITIRAPFTSVGAVLPMPTISCKGDQGATLFDARCVIISAMSGFQLFILAAMVVAMAAGGCFYVLWIRSRELAKSASRQIEELWGEYSRLKAETTQLKIDVAKATEAYTALRNREQNALAKAAEAHTALRNRAENALAKATEAYTALRNRAKLLLNGAAGQVKGWQARYERIRHWEGVENATQKALEVKGKITDLERTVEALRNVVDGYGSQYVMPPQSMLDDLAREAGHTDAGRRLKSARDFSRQLVKAREATSCDEPNQEQRGLIQNFVLDAFNGKIEAILDKVKSDNIGTLMQMVLDAYLLVNRQSKSFGNARIDKKYLAARIEELRWESLVQQYKKEENEEQRRVREQIREDAKVERELERAQQEAAKQAAAAERSMAELAKARTDAELAAKAKFERELSEQLAKVSASERALVESRMTAAHTQIMEAQRIAYEGRFQEQDAKLREALASGERAMSMAQQTKTGKVYIISNVGSFGENVYKIGMTRRLVPQERIDELSDASVPFEFDVHAWIHSHDAPNLERALHNHLLGTRVNKMNKRKEFFRVGVAEIRRIVEERGFSVEWTMVSKATEYRESLVLESKFAADPNERDRWIQENQIESAVDRKVASSLVTEGSEVR